MHHQIRSGVRNWPGSIDVSATGIVQEENVVHHIQTSLPYYYGYYIILTSIGLWL